MNSLKTRLAVHVLFTIGLLTCAFGQLTPSGDSYTNTAAPTTNYGAKTVLDVESSQTSFVQFNLSSIPSGYTGSEITKATLKLYVNAVTTAGSFNVDYVNGTWSENTIDASNAPALGTTIAASVPLTTAEKNQYILVDITAAVQAWLNGTPNDGIALVANSPLNASFDSKESKTTSHSAELDIVFAGGGGITGINTAVGSGLIGGGTSGTLNLSLTNVCAASQVLQWSGSAWACASPGTGTITGVTAGTDLLGGGTSGNVTLSLNTAATNGLYAQLGAANTFTANQTVNGTLTGSASSSSATAIQGIATSATGSTIGMLGQSSSPEMYSYGVEGSALYVGVYGDSQGSTSFVPEGGGGAGVWGDYGGETVPGVGVFGSAASFSAGGFYSFGLYPTLYSENDITTPGGEVFYGTIPSLGTNATAIIGDPECGSGFIALQLSLGGMSDCDNYTLTGGSNGETYLNTLAGKSVHLRVGNVDALRATSSGVAVVGTLSKGGGSFLIDHPLDPANKYLYHSFVESPDMMNIYNGNVTTDGDGLATISLPDWFSSLNRDFRYQLTVIGQFAQAIVASEISGNQFGIRTDKPNVKVSWQVTGIRQDAFANANRIPVEAEKAPADRGRYLYPEAIGAPATARIGYDAPPPGSEQIVHHRPPNPIRRNASPSQPITLPVRPKVVLPRVAPLQHVATLPHPPAQAPKLEVNQK